jgi:hypothetical protein
MPTRLDGDHPRLDQTGTPILSPSPGGDADPLDLSFL